MIEHGHEGRMRVLKGMSNSLKAAEFTYGPYGETVAIDCQEPKVCISKCGAGVLEDFDFSDVGEKAAAHLLANVSWEVHQSAGDGTTLAAILAYAISAETYRQYALLRNASDVSDGLQLAARMVEGFVAEQSRPISSADELIAVARSAAALDNALADLIADGFSTVEDPSAVFLMPAKSFTYDVVEGLLIDAHPELLFDHPCKSVVLTGLHSQLEPCRDPDCVKMIVHRP